MSFLDYDFDDLYDNPGDFYDGFTPGASSPGVIIIDSIPGQGTIDIDSHP